MPGTQINSSVLNELQRQLNYELGAAHAYQALAVWCKDQHFDGFAGFFQKQVIEERVHAQKIIDHLLDRSVLPELGSLSAPKSRFDSILNVAKQAQTMEHANTAGIHAAYAAAVKEGDLPAQVLLHWFINEQVEEEAWSECIQRENHACHPVCDGSRSRR